MIPLVTRHRTWSVALATIAAVALVGRVALAADADPRAGGDTAATAAAKTGRTATDVVPPKQRGLADTADAAAKAARAADVNRRVTDPGDVLARLLPPRSDNGWDWQAPLEPLHRCGEPRLLPTCVPPPPCHPAQPPRPFDLVGMPGAPTCGPIYRGPCAPRTGSRDDGPHPRIHRVHDRLFDWFYAPRTPILP